MDTQTPHAWPMAVQHVPHPWPEVLAEADLRWWARYTPGDRPGRRALAARWGWGHRRARTLISKVRS